MARFTFHQGPFRRHPDMTILHHNVCHRFGRFIFHHPLAGESAQSWGWKWEAFPHVPMKKYFLFVVGMNGSLTNWGQLCWNLAEQLLNISIKIWSFLKYRSIRWHTVETLNWSYWIECEPCCKQTSLKNNAIHFFFANANQHHPPPTAEHSRRDWKYASSWKAISASGM